MSKNKYDIFITNRYYSYVEQIVFDIYQRLRPKGAYWDRPCHVTIRLGKLSLAWWAQCWGHSTELCHSGTYSEFLISRVCTLPSSYSTCHMIFPWPLMEIWPLILLYVCVVVDKSCWQSDTSGWWLSWRHDCQLLWLRSPRKTLIDVLYHWILRYR